MKEYLPMPNFPYEYILEIPNDSTTLRFNSKFESGNLYKSIKLSDYDYNLYIHNDIGTYNQNHWYYFSVINPRKTSITFKIVNMRKKDMLYLSGMQPSVYSVKSFKEFGTRWHREGTNITYTENSPTSTANFVGRQKYYTLSFNYSFKFENDEVFFAYSVPYTYTDLTQYLENVRHNCSDIAEVTPLCKTIAGNVCYKLVITEGILNYNIKEKKIKKKKNLSKKERKAIVFMARVHSGETVSSYMMKGAIDYLLSSAARQLRKNYVFCVIPMLNPDGVRYGNYRASLLGVDLNRRWQKPHKCLHPTIYYAKKMIEELKNRHEIMLVCDLHGHTKKKNVFMYGCSLNSPETLDKERNLISRVIPYHLSRKNSFFSFQDSHFRIEKSKESTARIVLYQEFEITHSYTMEASFFGPASSESFGTNRNGDMHFRTEDLETLGMDLCRCCNFFTSHKIYTKKIKQTNNFLKEELLKEELSKLPEMKEEAEEDMLDEEVSVIIKEKACNEVDVVDVGADPESSGSESEPSDSEIPNGVPKKKSNSKPIPAIVKEEPMPSRTPNSSIKPLSVRKPQAIDSEWSQRRPTKSPMITFKPQETVSPQNFHFPLQSRFNPFALDIKLKSDIPELETHKRIPKISKSQKKPPVIPNKPKNTEMYLPALLNVNLPDIQSNAKQHKKRGREGGYSEYDLPQRDVYHVGSISYSENL